MNLRYAVRMLVKAPGFTLIAVLTLALGIGLNTVVFTLYESVAWKPLAVRSPEQIVRVAGRYDEHPIDALSYPEYEQLRSDNHSFSAMIATSAPQTILCTLPDAKPGEAAVVRARLVSANYFEALGVTPVLGRPFANDEAAAVVASHAFWKSRLRADSSTLGKTIVVQGAALSIVGVAPEAFAGTGLPAQMPDLWIPLSAQPVVLPGIDWLHDASAREWQILARLKPGVSVEQASAELDVAGRALAPLDGKQVALNAKKATFFQTDSGEFEVFGVVSTILLVAVGMILLIGCVNLVNLLLARNAEREHEIAVRLALGAGRMQLVRQLCTESLVLGVLGGAGGLLLSLWSCEWIRVWLAQTLDRTTGGALTPLLDVAPDWRVLAYTAALSVLTGIAVGVWPAVHAARSDVSSALKQGLAGAGSGARSFWSKRNLLLTAQVAACLVLLAGAGLLFRGVWRSETVDPASM